MRVTLTTHGCSTGATPVSATEVQNHRLRAGTPFAFRSRACFYRPVPINFNKGDCQRPMDFEILSAVTQVETIATGCGIRGLSRLQKTYGRGRWRKRKGIARIRLANGRVRLAEIHWYEAHGIGRQEIKRKTYLD